MTLRIIDAELQLEHAFEVLEDTLSAWAGGKADIWQKLGRGGVSLEGASFARRDDVYLFVERSPKDVATGVVLAEKDRPLLRIEIPRREPARDRRRIAAALDDNGEAYLLVSLEELRRQGVREPFRRLAGAAHLKRANVADRDYALIGPLSDPRSADALMALASLAPDFERHVERLGRPTEDHDDADMYRVSAAVQRQHRVEAKIARALLDRFRQAGFEVEELRHGPVRADLAVRRGEVALAALVRADAELDDFLKGLGRLLLVAPESRGWRRLIALPAPRDPIGQALAPFEATFRELRLALVFFDFRTGEAAFALGYEPEGFPPELKAALS